MMTQTRLNSQGGTPFVQYCQPDGFHKASKNWRVNTGFKKLQKRIEDRQRSGKTQILNKPLPVLTAPSRKSGGLTSSRLQGESASAVTLRPHNDVTETDAKRKDSAGKNVQSRSMLWRSVTTSGSKTRDLSKREGPSEFSTSLQYELYRTSNNGLARISARMKKNAFRLPSQASLDFSDSLSFENNYPEKCSEQQTPPKLPVIAKPNPVLLKTEVAKLDSCYDSDFEEELEERIIKWIANCKLWDTFDGRPYNDLDKKQRKSSSKNHVTSTPRSKVTDTSHGLDRSNTCL